MPDEQISDATPLTPGDALRQKLDERGWTQEDLAVITGRSRQTIGAVVLGKAEITLEMAASLGAAFGDDPDYWIRLDSAVRLRNVRTDIPKTKRLAGLFKMAPVRDMQKRGWIRETNDLDDLATQLNSFLRPATVATRSSAIDTLSPVQRAWCARARQLAETLTVGQFKVEKSSQLKSNLRELAAYPKEVRHLPDVFAQFGIRFVVVEPLAGAKIDGAAFWLDDDKPAIAVSLRYDRVDAFWHTVMHECSHIVHQDLISVDTDMIGEAKDHLATNETERRADYEASSSLIPPGELDSFIRRVAPLYSKVRIVQFAHRIKIHPGIVVGQLQHRGQIAYSTNREMLVKIRADVIETAFTDGWGNIITPSVFEENGNEVGKEASY
jgi:HTH-type transcriptional regulator/antitoxin HigA